MKMKFLYSVLLLCFIKGFLCQQNEQKRLVCEMVDADPEEPIRIETEKDEGLKILPFSLSFARDILQSAIPILKDLPAVDTPDELDPLPIETQRKNLSVTCDVVSSQVKEQLLQLEGQVAKLTQLVEEMENNAACPGGVTYLDRCYRLMEIRGKKFAQHKAEDLCNFNGGVLARFDSALAYTTVASYVHDKFSDPKYGNATTLQAWTGMTYELPSVGLNPGPFPLPVLNQENKKLEELNKIISWYPGFPKESLALDKIALQFRFAGPTRKKILRAGAMNAHKRKKYVPLCQFQMQDWQKPDSVSARLFRFNF